MDESVGTPRTLAGQIGLLWRSREILLLWTWREIRAQYSQTLAGIGWAFFQPLATMATLVVVFGYFARIPIQGGAVPFYYVGVLPWTFFQTALLQGIPSVQKQMHILSRIYFPREIVPLAVILARLADFLVGATLLVGIVAIYDLPVTPALLWLPVILGLQLLFTCGVVVVFSGVNIFIRDLGIVIPLVAQLWMFLTPVIYPLEAIGPQWRTAYLLLNPMATIVDSYRRVLLLGVNPDLALLGECAAVSLGVSVAGLAYFKRLEPRMSDIG